MLVALGFVSFPKIFFILLVVSVFSGVIILIPKIPLNFVRFHIGIISLPTIAALLALIFNHGSVTFGPWRFNSLSWLLSAFVLTIGLIVQRYCLRYLLGDRTYRKYFALITITTVADAIAWLSDDLRWLLICWGITLIGLTLIIRLRKEWRVARYAATITGRLFALSWLILLGAIIWVAKVTGHWRLSLILTQNSLAQFDSYERTCIGLLLVIAVVIPAAQWPFHRWLLDSVVAPTPISAVMHAGIVNAGSIILTRFAPLFNSTTAHMILFILSCISVLMGTGMMLVQVDYKRQLVGSTIAQMGFMLIQCALGAYGAAVVHAVLHGLFKATLFLQAGFVRHTEPDPRIPQRPSWIWMLAGGALGLEVGVSFWLASSKGVYQLISALILGWAVSFAWMHLVAFGRGRTGLISGLFIFVGATIAFRFIQVTFDGLLHETVHVGMQLPMTTGVLFLFVLLIASTAGAWFVRCPLSTVYTVIYLWLVHWSEPKNDSVEIHPKYLIRSLSGR